MNDVRYGGRKRRPAGDTIQSNGITQSLSRLRVVGLEGLNALPNVYLNWRSRVYGATGSLRSGEEVLGIHHERRGGAKAREDGLGDGEFLE